MNEKWTTTAFKDLFARFGQVLDIEPQGASVFHVYLSRPEITLAWFKALEKELKRHDLRIFGFRINAIQRGELQVSLVITPR